MTEVPRLSAEEQFKVEQYDRAKTIATHLVGIARSIPKQERGQYGIPDFVDLRGMRNSLARTYLKSDPHEEDDLHIGIAQGISKWFIDSLPRIQHEI